jgi:ketosteroid isomerase-like protein
MSQANVELAKEGLEAFHHGDIAWFDEHSIAEVVIVQPPEVPDTKSYEGPSAWADALADWSSEWEDFRVDFIEVIDVSDDVVILGTRHRGRGAHSGIEMDFQVFYVTYIRDGKATRQEMFFTREQALRAVGLSA